jgi:sirohydrochlorin ferrochelatase
LATGVLGLASDRVIRIWKQQHPEMEEMIATLQAAPLLRHRRDVFEALAASAATPDPRHHADRKLALEMLGDYRPRGDLDVHTTGGGLTLAEWQAAAAARCFSGLSRLRRFCRFA